MFTNKTSCTVPILYFLLLVLAGCGGGVSLEMKAGGITNGSGGTPYTGNGILSWSSPTLYSDGSQIAAGDIKEYRVYFSTQSGTYSSQYYPVFAPNTSVYVKNINLTVGQYYFVVTALDSWNMESDFSNEVPALLQ